MPKSICTPVLSVVVHRSAAAAPADGSTGEGLVGSAGGEEAFQGGCAIEVVVVGAVHGVERVGADQDHLDVRPIGEVPTNSTPSSCVADPA